MRSVDLIVDSLHLLPDARRTIERALAGEPGAVRVHVNLPVDTVYVAYDPFITGPEALVAALARYNLYARDGSDDGAQGAPQRPAQSGARAAAAGGPAPAAAPRPADRSWEALLGLATVLLSSLSGVYVWRRLARGVRRLQPAR